MDSLEIGTADLRGFSAVRICCGSFEFGEAKLKVVLGGQHVRNNYKLVHIHWVTGVKACRALFLWKCVVHAFSGRAIHRHIFWVLRIYIE